MTNFDVLDKYNENFTTLSNEELAETNGGLLLEGAGVALVVKWTVAGVGLIFASGVFVGYTNAKRP